MKNFLLDRLKEASTWRGIVMLVTAAGIGVTPDQLDLIVTAGLGLVGAIGAFMPDK